MADRAPRTYAKVADAMGRPCTLEEHVGGAVESVWLCAGNGYAWLGADEVRVLRDGMTAWLGEHYPVEPDALTVLKARLAELGSCTHLGNLPDGAMIHMTESGGLLCTACHLGNRVHDQDGAGAHGG